MCLLELFGGEEKHAKRRDEKLLDAKRAVTKEEVHEERKTAGEKKEQIEDRMMV